MLATVYRFASHHTTQRVTDVALQLVDGPEPAVKENCKLLHQTVNAGQGALHCSQKALQLTSQQPVSAIKACRQTAQKLQVCQLVWCRQGTRNMLARVLYLSGQMPPGAIRN